MSDRQWQALELVLRRVRASLSDAVHIDDCLARVGLGLMLEDQFRHTVKPAKAISLSQVGPCSQA